MKLVGDGEMKEKLLSLKKEFSLEEVELADFMPPAEIRKVMEQAPFWTC